MRPDDDADLAGVTAGQSLKFTVGQFERINADAALSAAIRQVNRRTFDGHPCGERHHFIKVDIRMVANTAFSWAARKVVLNAIAFEMAN